MDENNNNTFDLVSVLLILLLKLFPLIIITVSLLSAQGPSLVPVPVAGQSVKR